jgi:hypothetical protein
VTLLGALCVGVAASFIRIYFPVFVMQFKNWTVQDEQHLFVLVLLASHWQAQCRQSWCRSGSGSGGWAPAGLLRHIMPQGQDETAERMNQ